MEFVTHQKLLTVLAYMCTMYSIIMCKISSGSLKINVYLATQNARRPIIVSCNVPPNSWYYWTDSIVAIAWIKAPSHTCKTSVANRVIQIQEITSDNWNHVESYHNPVDRIS